MERETARRSGAAAGAPAAALAARTGGRPEHALLALQQAVGNQATAAFVQRQPLDTDQDTAPGPDAGPASPVLTDEPLDAAAVDSALRYYRVQPWLYTPKIVSEVRGRLGLPDGGIDAALAQAVARIQRDEFANDPALNVDGKAGPRTMPRLFPSGLNAAGEGEKFGAAAQTSVIDGWETLGTAQARADKLVELVNERLKDASVPPVTAVVYDGDSPKEQGSFDFGPWAMRLNRLLLEQDGLDQATAKELVNTVYHEARHTEQWFRMAQLRAGQGAGVAAIITELGIRRPDVVPAAKKLPLKPGTKEAVIAQGWWDSVYGDFSPHRDAVLTQIEDADWAVTEAECRCQRQPSPANDERLAKAKARFDVLHEQYRDLPEENDAWATGPSAEPGVTRGTPHPKAPPDDDPCERLRKAKRPVPAAAAAADGPFVDFDQPTVGGPPFTEGLHGNAPEENLA